MIKYKSNALIIILALLSFSIGIGARPVINLIAAWTCNLECQAQLLYKNTAFFEVRGTVSEIKKNPVTKVIFNQNRYSQKYLRESGIDLLVVMDSGDFFVTSRLGKLAMLAKPIFEGNQLIWHCQFFSDTPKPPVERVCSY